MTIAFVTTSLIAFLTALIGYFCLSIPAYLLNDLDVVIINGCRKAFGCTNDIKTVKQASNLARSEALQSFVLPLIDQQLVTGMALLIASFARHSSMTVYSMNVTAALAMLSGDIHSITLPLVRLKLRHYTLSKHIRVLFMIGSFVMLSYVTILTFGTFWQDQIFVSCGVSRFTLKGVDVSNCVAQLYVLISIMFSYVRGIIGLYSQEDSPGDYFLTWLYAWNDIVYRPTWQQYVSHRTNATIDQGWNRATASRLLELFVFHEYFESFAWSISCSSYIQIYGLINLLQTRADTRHSTGDMNLMGFGQVVAIALLMVPLLAAIEACDS